MGNFKSIWFLAQSIFLFYLSQLVSGKLSKPKSKGIVDHLTVHVIAHTHDDVGWVKTVDQYYTSEVRYILDGVVDALQKDPTKKFIYVEMAFFTRWWYEQTDDMQNIVQGLVQNGQLVFVNGGWTMNDEANPYYEDIIDNMCYGHQFILETFNKVPSAGWHIDPFGHSAAQPILFSQMGFNSFFFWRVDYEDRLRRANNQQLEFYWNPPLPSKIDRGIFTSLLYHQYEWPSGFCFDITCYGDYFDNPDIESDPKLQTFNIQQRADVFVQYFQEMANDYSTNQLLHTFGSDFNWQDAERGFYNVDLLMNYINQNTEYNMTVQYSTPDEYVLAVNSINNTYTVKTDDFFPYASDFGGSTIAYWTGYYTSRVAQKYNIKQTGRYLQSVRNMLSFLQINNTAKHQLNTTITQLNFLEQAMATNTHHDAVSGTETQAVADNYVQYISNGTNSVLDLLQAELSFKNNNTINETSTFYYLCNWNTTTTTSCPFANQSLSSKKPILLTVYNPTIARNQLIRAKVIGGAELQIVNGTNDNLTSSVFCLNQTDANDCDLYFVAALQPFSYNYFKIVYVKSTIQSSSSTSSKSNQNYNQQAVDFVQQCSYMGADRYLSFGLTANQNIQFSICNDSLCKNCDTNNTQNIGYNYYKSFQMFDSMTSQPNNYQLSGAYAFRPGNTTEFNSTLYAQFSTCIFSNGTNGTILSIIMCQSPQITAFIKFFKNGTFISSDLENSTYEIETYVNSIDISDLRGKEITMNIQSNVQNNGVFYTDANGLTLQKRTLNYRPTWNLDLKNNTVTGNYYPINAMIAIQDANNSLYVLNDRSQGGSSLQSGNIEIMIHRRMLWDDGFGVNEPLNETNEYDDNGLIARMRHYVIMTNSSVSNQIHRKLQFHLDLEPIVFYSNTTSNNFSKPYIGVTINIDFQTVEYLKVYVQSYRRAFGQYIVRFHNMNEQVSFNVTMPKLTKSHYTEMSLTANQNLSTINANRLNWTTQSATPVKDHILKLQQAATQETMFELEDNGSFDNMAPIPNDNLTILPMEIRTFLFFYNANGNDLTDNQEESYIVGIDNEFI